MSLPYFYNTLKINCSILYQEIYGFILNISFSPHNAGGYGDLSLIGEQHPQDSQPAPTLTGSGPAALVNPPCLLREASPLIKGG
jgi:hypothetical protein